MLQLNLKALSTADYTLYLFVVIIIIIFIIMS